MQITFTTDYNTALSINMAYGYRGKRKYMRPATKAAMDKVGWDCHLANRGRVWNTGKVRVEILVHRPDMRCDPDNLEKLIVDAIKKIIRVDDTWYEAHTKWQMAADKKRPFIMVTVTQGKER